MVNFVKGNEKLLEKRIGTERRFARKTIFYTEKVIKNHENRGKMLNFFEKSLICLLFFIFCDKFER